MYRWVRGFLDQHELPGGVGAGRLVGESGVVTVDIEPDDTDRRGRVDDRRRGMGRAEQGRRSASAAGTRVRVAAVVGTRVVVEPIGRRDVGYRDNREDAS